MKHLPLVAAFALLLTPLSADAYFQHEGYDQRPTSRSVVRRAVQQIVVENPAMLGTPNYAVAPAAFGGGEDETTVNSKEVWENLRFEGPPNRVKLWRFHERLRDWTRN